MSINRGEGVEYFIKRTDERLQSIEKKVDELLAFKWQIIGGSAVVSALVTLVIEIFIKK